MTNKHLDFIQKLEHQLAQELPGLDAQKNMAALERKAFMKRAKLSNLENINIASVIVLLYEHQNQIYSVLMHRTSGGPHSNQVSFPGGRQEPDDKDLAVTALREAEEEVGVKASDIQLIGQLSQLYIPPSNFLVTPFVGYIPYRPTFVGQASEVRSIIEYPILKILDQSIKKEQEMIVRNYTFTAPYYEINDFVVWGATAMMLSELEHILAVI